MTEKEKVDLWNTHFPEGQQVRYSLADQGCIKTHTTSSAFLSEHDIAVVLIHAIDGAPVLIQSLEAYNK